MDKKVSAENLAAEIQKGIATYTENIAKSVNESVKKITPNIEEKTVKDLSPVRKSGTVYTTRNGKRVKAKANLQPGAYKKGWRSKTSEKTVGRIYGTIYNKTNWQLTWLLELGHKAKNGKFVEPSPMGGHIQPSQEKAMAALDKEIKKILNK